jgi:probable addiction module antidote protein
MPRPTTTTWDVVEHLKTEEDMAQYLEAALEDGSPDLIAAALGDIARACGKADTVADLGLRSQISTDAESQTDDFDLAAALKAIKALGLRLRVSAGH